MYVHGAVRVELLGNLVFFFLTENIGLSEAFH